MSGAVESRDDLNAVLVSLGEDLIHVILVPISVGRLRLRNIVSRSVNGHIHTVKEETCCVVIRKIKIQHVHLVP